LQRLPPTDPRAARAAVSPPSILLSVLRGNMRFAFLPSSLATRYGF
jgi:hypothetical protein